MADLIKASKSCACTTCDTVFIDTSLDTHLALFVSCSDTVSDLKNKILHEHRLCFPKIGEIKVDAVKVKRRGFFYHLPDSMLITSVFSGVRKSWFINVDAVIVEESDKNGGRFDRVNFESECRSLVPLEEKKQEVVNQRQSDVNVGKDLSNLEMVEHSGNDIGEIKSSHTCKSSIFPSKEHFNRCGDKTQTGGENSKPVIRSGDIQRSVHGEGAQEIGSGGKRLHKRKRQVDIEGEDLNLEVADASVPESATSELHKEILMPEDVLGDAGGVVSLDMETDIHNTAYEHKMVPASDVFVEKEGPGDDVLCESDKFKSTFDNDLNNDLEATLPPKPFAKKKRKTGKEKAYKDSMDGASLPDSDKGNKKVVTYQSSEKKRKEKKSSDPVNTEAAERLSAPGAGMEDMDPASSECIQDSSKLSISFIGGTRSSEDFLLNDSQNDALHQINNVEDERKSSLDDSSKATPSEMFQLSGQDERELRGKEINSNKLPEVDETLDSRKSCKKRSKSKRTTLSVNQRHIKSDITHAEGSVTDGEACTASIAATLSAARENRGPEDASLDCCQKAAADKPNRVEEDAELSLVSAKTMPSDICQSYASGETKMKTVGMPLEVGEPVSSGKSSKKKRKSRKVTGSTNETPVVSEAEHVKASIASTKPFKAMNKDGSINISDPKGRDMLLQDRIERSDVGIVNSDILATDRENDLVIQNLHVEQIDETQLKTEDVDGKSKIKATKKQNSDAKHSNKLQTKDGNVNLNGFEIGHAPSVLDVGGNNSLTVGVEPKDLGVGPDTAHFSTHSVQDEIISGPFAVRFNGKGGDPAQEIDKRPSSPDIEMDDVEATMVKSLKSCSNQTIASSAKGMRRSDISLNGSERAGAEQINGVETERKTPFDIASKTILSEMGQPSDHFKGEIKTKEVSSEFLEVGKPVDPRKSSMRKKKSRKTAVSESKAPVITVDEPVKTSSSLAEPLEAFDVDRFIGKTNKESNIRAEDEKTVSEVGTIGSFPLATDKEINDVIQNVVESVKLIDKPQLVAEAVSGKLKRESKKKKISDAKNSTKLQTRIVDNDLKVPSPSTHVNREVDSSSKIVKQAKMIDSSTLVCDKDDGFENDSLGTPLNSATIDRSQVPQLKFGDRHDDTGFGGVVNGYPPKSRHPSKSSNDLEVSCESNGISFRDYFMSSQEQHGIVGYKVPVDTETRARKAGEVMKTCKTISKHDKHSEPSPNLQSLRKLNEKDEIRAKPQTETLATAEFQQTASDDKHEKFTLESNTKLSKYTGSGKKPPTDKQRLNSGAKEAKRSSTSKARGSTASLNKDKDVQDKSNSALESSEGTVSQYKKDPVHSSNERFGNEDGINVFTTPTRGVVDSSKPGKRLMGKPSKQFDDDNYGSSANKFQVDDSDSSIRTPSDDSVSSDYSDGESSAGSFSSTRDHAGGKKTKKPIGYSGMTLDEILKSSSRFKKAKITASQLQMEDDLDSQPVDMVPDSQPQI